VRAFHRPRPSAIWRQRDFRLLWTGETISIVGSGVSDFALPLVAVLTLHVTPSQLGLMRAIGSAPGIVLGLLAGVWVDRLSKQRLLIVLNLIAAALMASVPIASAFGGLSLFHLYALWFAFGVIGPFWWPAWNSFLPSIVSPDELVEANSKVVFSWSASGIVGPALGGLLVAWFTAPGALVFDAATFVACAAFTVAIRSPGASLAEPREPSPVPRLILDFIDAMSAAVFAIYVIREVRLSAALFGLALALSSVGFVVGSGVAPKIERRAGIGSMIVIGLLLVAVSPYTMVIANRAFPDPVNVVLLAMPGWIGGLGGIVQFVGLSTLRQSITPDAVLGRVFASASVAGRLMTLAGALTGGFLGEAIGLRPTIAVSAVAYAVPFFYSLVSPLRTAARPAGETVPD
jgi:MFS family permease